MDDMIEITLKFKRFLYNMPPSERLKKEIANAFSELLRAMGFDGKAYIVFVDKPLSFDEYLQLGEDVESLITNQPTAYTALNVVISYDAQNPNHSELEIK